MGNGLSTGLPTAFSHFERRGRSSADRGLGAQDYIAEGNKFKLIQPSGPGSPIDTYYSRKRPSDNPLTVEEVDTWLNWHIGEAQVTYGDSVNTAVNKHLMSASGAQPLSEDDIRGGITPAVETAQSKIEALYAQADAFYARAQKLLSDAVDGWYKTGYDLAMAGEPALKTQWHNHYLGVPGDMVDALELGFKEGTADLVEKQAADVQAKASAIEQNRLEGIAYERGKSEAAGSALIKTFPYTKSQAAEAAAFAKGFKEAKESAALVAKNQDLDRKGQRNEPYSAWSLGKTEYLAAHPGTELLGAGYSSGQNSAVLAAEQAAFNAKWGPIAVEKNAAWRKEFEVKSQNASAEAEAATQIYKSAQAEADTQARQKAAEAQAIAEQKEKIRQSIVTATANEGITSVVRQAAIANQAMRDNAKLIAETAQQAVIAATAAIPSTVSIPSMLAPTSSVLPNVAVVTPDRAPVVVADASMPGSLSPAGVPVGTEGPQTAGLFGGDMKTVALIAGGLLILGLVFGRNKV